MFFLLRQWGGMVWSDVPNSGMLRHPYPHRPPPGPVEGAHVCRAGHHISSTMLTWDLGLEKMACQLGMAVRPSSGSVQADGKLLFYFCETVRVKEPQAQSLCPMCYRRSHETCLINPFLFGSLMNESRSLSSSKGNT